MAWNGWDPPEKQNPETCEHKRTKYDRHSCVVICLDCDTEVYEDSDERYDAQQARRCAV
jgi:hypothetical protein